MNQFDFHLFLWLMSGIALFVFIALHFVHAGYGIFRISQWGRAIPNKWGWVLMEAPVFFMMFWLWKRSGVRMLMPEFFFFILFQLHYFQRSILFPLLMKGNSRMPVLIMGAEGCVYFFRSHAWIGFTLFITGMTINLHSDQVIRQLRHSGDIKHYLPFRGFYRYVTSANYFGELLTASPATRVFVWWTFAKLAPRAGAIHKRYRQEFDNEAAGKRIIPFVY